MARHKRRPPPKRKKDNPADDKKGSHGGNPTQSGGSGGGTTSSGGAGTASASGDITGNPALTGATTTANPANTALADQADQDLEAFFSSGTGPAMHYSYQPGAGVGMENPSTTTGATSGGVSA